MLHDRSSAGAAAADTDRFQRGDRGEFPDEARADGSVKVFLSGRRLSALDRVVSGG